MIHITQQASVLMEPHCFEYTEEEPLGLSTYYGGNWAREYVALLKQFVSDKQIGVTKIPEDVWPVEPWKESGAVLEVVM